ncbi:hypothetical protein FJT64_005304 [Amphibalanus amphitrite]|uniref:Uncharacterized protein n=1 Tax=Amphibalanus amphitrite TaxID=1232801 RepID=A0A6A4W0K4_AMPAM|nr:hypothetical protein FJT64_005304 [Amphibalanus amphitrite]
MKQSTTKVFSHSGAGRLPATRIISTDLDLKRCGLVVGVTPSGPPAGRLQSELQRRLRRHEQLRRQLTQERHTLGQLERRRDLLTRIEQSRANDKDASGHGKRFNALKTVHDKFEDMMKKMHIKEARRSIQRPIEESHQPQEGDADLLETVVRQLSQQPTRSRAVQREEAAARRQRRRDAALRRRAAEALYHHQARVEEAVRTGDRAELRRLLRLPQPHLEARMSRYSFMDYPANASLRRLLHQYKRKRIDEQTFSQQAAALARKLSPRRILLHQNLMLRDQQAAERAAGGRRRPWPVLVSERAVSERVLLQWPTELPPSGAAPLLARRLADEALGRAGALFGHLLARSELDLLSLLDDPGTRTFEDDGDLSAPLSAFDFGDDLLLDEAAAERIQAMYHGQACRQRSAREARPFPSGEVGAFSSALLDPAVSCSCTTLSGVDSQCSLCQLAGAPGPPTDPDERGPTLENRGRL